MDLWGDDTVVGGPDRPFLDHKSLAWLRLELRSAEILFQRRFNGTVRAQAIIGNACLFGKDRFVQLFGSFDTTNCAAANITVITPATNASGLASADYQEGSGTHAIASANTNGWCWNGGDSVNNTFRGHAGWNAAGDACLSGGHRGYIGVFEGTKAIEDISNTNWVAGTNRTKTDVSFFAR
jgi:hypothetical protein